MEEIKMTSYACNNYKLEKIEIGWGEFYNGLKKYSTCYDNHSLYFNYKDFKTIEQESYVSSTMDKSIEPFVSELFGIKMNYRSVWDSDSKSSYYYLSLDNRKSRVKFVASSKKMIQFKNDGTINIVSDVDNVGKMVKL